MPTTSRKTTRPSPKQEHAIWEDHCRGHDPAAIAARHLLTVRAVTRVIEERRDQSLKEYGHAEVQRFRTSLDLQRQEIWRDMDRLDEHETLARIEAIRAGKPYTLSRGSSRARENGRRQLLAIDRAEAQMLSLAKATATSAGDSNWARFEAALIASEQPMPPPPERDPATIPPNFYEGLEDMDYSG